MGGACGRRSFFALCSTSQPSAFREAADDGVSAIFQNVVTLRVGTVLSCRRSSLPSRQPQLRERATSLRAEARLWSRQWRGVSKNLTRQSPHTRPLWIREERVNYPSDGNSSKEADRSAAGIVSEKFTNRATPTIPALLTNC